jgi:hypothetical protein
VKSLAGPKQVSVKSQAGPHQVSGKSRVGPGQVPDKVPGKSGVQVPAKSRQGSRRALIWYVNLRMRCLKLENGLRF